jgi:class 3 adenylate cyclase
VTSELNDSAIAAMTLADLQRRCETGVPDEWLQDANRLVEAGRRAIEFGEPGLAFDLLKSGRSQFADNAEIDFVTALALARSGSINAAKDLVDSALTKAGNDGDLRTQIASLAGRLAKDRYERLLPGPERKAAALASAQSYGRAFADSQDSFPAINAATMSLLAGEQAAADEYARRVLDLNDAGNDPAHHKDHWSCATFGEASLLCGNPADAIGWYRRACEIAGDRFGDIASMRRQLELLAEALPAARQVLEALPVGGVVAFSGHMIDAPGRPRPRFPAGLERDVRDAIRSSLDKLDARYGFCSAACGGDIIFIEEMYRRGAEVEIVLPFRKEDFIPASVAFAGQEWISRFEAALASATRVRYATEEGYLGDDVLFVYTADLIEGYASLRAQRLVTTPTLVTALEIDDEQLTGGTAHAVSRWTESGLPVEHIDIGVLRSGTAQETAAGAAESSTAIPGPVADASRIGRQVKGMLFADVVGFSKLEEEDTPAFFVSFMQRVAQVIATAEPAPEFCNTWGDGLFLVFSDLRAAARFALDLRDMVVGSNWAETGLPEDTSIRIAMHAGPVYEAMDPIIRRTNYFGSHVNRAARIEPVTAPGAVFLSEQSASLLARLASDEFACDYVGTTALAKRFGSSTLYRLRRLSEVQ